MLRPPQKEAPPDMQKVGSSILLSASDLVGHLHWRHLTALDLEVANGKVEKPKFWDPFREILLERGRRHEEGTIEHLNASGLAVAVIEGVGVDLGAEARGDGSRSGRDRPGGVPVGRLDLALELEADVGNTDRVGSPMPFANESRAGFDLGPWRRRNRSARFELRGQGH